MADQYLALPLNQEAEPSQSRLSGKVTFLSVLISLGCVALWASDKFNPQVAAVDDATSLAVQPMKRVMQPARYVMPMQRVQSRNFMQPRAVFNEMQEAAMGPDTSRRAILAGLAMLPIATIADQSKAAPRSTIPVRLKVDKFVPYFNYNGTLAVKGNANLEGFRVSTDGYKTKYAEGVSIGQKLEWNLEGMDSKCKGKPGDKPNSCGIHIHKGTSCKEDALEHFYKGKEDPWKTVTYKVKYNKAIMTNGPVPVATQLNNGEVNGHTLIVHDFEGARVACGILKK